MKAKSISEAIVLHLADRENEWVPSYQLVQKNLYGKFTGTSADRRARELAEEGVVKIGPLVYEIERRQSGKYAEYRCLGAKDTTPQYQMEMRGGERVMVRV